MRFMSAGKLACRRAAHAFVPGTGIRIAIEMAMPAGERMRIDLKHHALIPDFDLVSATLIATSAIGGTKSRHALNGSGGDEMQFVGAHVMLIVVFFDDFEATWRRSTNG